MIASCHPTFCNITTIGSFPFGGAFEDWDLKTGIPWAAQSKNNNGGIPYGDGTFYPLGFTRSQLSKLWFTAKELTVACPTGTSIISIPKIFNEYAGAAVGIIGQNPFKTMGASFAFPLWYEFNLDDFGTVGVNRSLHVTVSANIGPTSGSATLVSDLIGKYYPSIRFTDTDGTNTADTVGSGATTGQLTFMGSGLSCNLYGTGSYGNVDITITATW